MTGLDNRQAQPGLKRWNAVDVACVVVLVAYFLHFALPSLAGGFSGDDMMNMYEYWNAGISNSLWANVCFWTPFRRPGGALYYLLIYHFFTLNPQPYHLIQISILAATIPIMYHLARLVTSSRSVAFLTVLACCYHSQVAKLVFIGGFIYDVLCGFFYFAALTYYIHIREKGVSLHPLQLLGFLAFYVCALNSKEMAVTLPVIVLIYEALKCPRLAEWKQFLRRNWRSASPVLIAGALTAVYLYGEIHGPVIGLDPYRPEFSWHNFITSNAAFAGELINFCPSVSVLSQKALLVISSKTILIWWAAVFVYAFMRRDRALKLMAFWIAIVPLPIAFIRPIRGGACLYLLLFGWAMIFAKIAWDVITIISKSFTLLGQGAAVGAATGAMIGGVATNRVRAATIGAAMGAAAGSMSRRVFGVFATFLVAAWLAIFTQWENQRSNRTRVLLRSTQKTIHVIQAFSSLNLHPAPGSTILIRGGPFFANDWDPLFVAALVLNDHSQRIYVGGANELSEQQVAQMDYIVSLTEFNAELVRAPGSQFR